MIQHYVLFHPSRSRKYAGNDQKHCFAIGIDATGRDFIYQVQGERDKNHSVNEHSFDTIGEGRIYANDGSKCPVACFKKYISKLNPNQDSLWQRPK